VSVRLRRRRAYYDNGRYQTNTRTHGGSPGEAQDSAPERPRELTHAHHGQGMKPACVSAFLALTCGLTALAQTQPPEIPLVPGLTFVLAVHNPLPGKAGTNIAQGDYEMVVAVSGVDANSLTLSTSIDAFDEAKKPLQLRITRRIARTDLAGAREQILGFHTDDPREISATTSLGPSLAIVQDLQKTGRAAYSVRNFRHLSLSSGTLTRADPKPVPFPVLLNGRRVTLAAIRATGQLKYGENVRPWEFLLLDHPQHPVTLRFTVGAVSTGFPFTPEITREVVRIDFPVENTAIEDALRTSCRVEVPGIYFDFDRATLKPESRPTLMAIADMMKRQQAWRVAIEGHTDNVGTDAYNNDLSSRRAAAVLTALTREYAIAANRLTSAGLGERRPVETNDTIAGRARNRRVELVRDCSKRP
jgi:outer membrane protein OmpA-like peptidoglycan-associated protein